MHRFRRLRLVCRILAACLGAGVAARGQTAACLECHEAPDLTLERGGRLVPLTVSALEFAGTPHEGMDCTDCHAGLDGDAFPHADPIPAAVAACRDCHGGLAASHAFHPDFGDPDAAGVLRVGVNCTDCHGRHRILPRGDAAFPFAAKQQTGRCGSCHEMASIDYLHSSHARALAENVPGAPACLDCHASPCLTDANGLAAAGRKVRLADLCTRCHVENPDVAGRTLYGTPFITSYRDSVHGRALYGGNAQAPTCADCHDAHMVGRAVNPTSTISRGNIVKNCAQCHADAAESYLTSVHASALVRGHRLAPTCTDCHGEHNIMAPTDPGAPVAPVNLSRQVCGGCHGSVRFSERYGVPGGQLRTYEDSFHGLAARGGAVEVVNCASCHGYHDVRSPADPQSMTHPDNLAATCGSCHPGANERFAHGRVHVAIDRTSAEPVLYWIATLYLWGIVLIIGGMVLHNGLDFLHKLRHKARLHWRPHEHTRDEVPHRLYLRMTLNERLQHGLLALSFIVLVVTGFMLRYPEAWWVVPLRNLSSHAFEWRGLLHRIAGVVMCLAGVWHLAYITLTRRGRELFRDLLPRRKDLHDLKGVFRYNLGLQKDKPLFARFSYIEKAEYWALIWGSVIMSATGFLLWFESTTIGWFTKLGFDISRTVHFYEAVLASLAIVVWHFYAVIFNPDVYPMNLAWLTGKMSEEEMETEHPLELERLRRLEAERRQEGAPGT